MSRFPLFGALLLLTGCTAGTDYRPPDLPIARTWNAAGDGVQPIRDDWWNAYDDPVLTALVDRALAHNPDIDAALARIEQARAGEGFARAAQLPAGNIDGSLARTRQSTAAGLGQLTRYVPDFSRTQDQAMLDTGLSWDLDFAGGLRRGREAARADLAESGAGLDAARLGIAVEVVDTYLGLRGAQAQLAIMERRQTLLTDRRNIMAARVHLGETAAQGLDESEAVLASVAATIPLHRAAIDVARHRLAILTGETAGTEISELGNALPIPNAPDPAAGVPADILRHRPDLIAAEARLMAAHARIGVALSEYWPKFSLSGLLGFSSNGLARFGTGSSGMAQGVLGLRWRLFDFGRIDAQVANARGAEHEALATYRSAVLAAGEQVESALVTLEANRAELDRRAHQLASSASAAQRAQSALRVGEISRDQYRVAELNRLEAEEDGIASRVSLARAVLACHRALGRVPAVPAPGASKIVPGERSEGDQGSNTHTNEKRSVKT